MKSLVIKNVRSTILDNEIEIEIPENYNVSNLIFDYYEIILDSMPEVLLNVYNIKMYVYATSIFENYGDFYPINTKISDIPYKDIYIYVEYIKS